MRYRLLVAVALAVAAQRAAADILILANGDEISGEIVEWTVGHVVLDHPQLGRLRLELDQLRLDTGKPPSPGLLGTGFLRGWNRRLDLGLNGKQGNSATTNFTAGTDLTYRDDWTGWRINGRYFYSTSDDGDDENNARVDFRRDWLFPDSRWFIFNGGRYQFDQFEAWKHRLSAYAGPGFHLIRAEAHSLDLMVGPGFTREFGDSNVDKSEVVFSVDYAWNISERTALSFLNSYFLETSPDAGAGRNFTTLNWSTRITLGGALSFNLGIENEFETNPDPGDKSNDLKYYATLGIDL